MVPLDYYIILSAFLFVIGVLGVILSRNLIVMFMAVEIMLNAANLAIMAFSRYLKFFFFRSTFSCVISKIVFLSRLISSSNSCSLWLFFCLRLFVKPSFMPC